MIAKPKKDVTIWTLPLSVISLFVVVLVAACDE